MTARQQQVVVKLTVHQALPTKRLGGISLIRTLAQCVFIGFKVSGQRVLDAFIQDALGRVSIGEIPRLCVEGEVDGGPSRLGEGKPHCRSGEHLFSKAGNSTVSRRGGACLFAS
jgi:hypothetical protein